MDSTHDSAPCVNCVAHCPHHNSRCPRIQSCDAHTLDMTTLPLHTVDTYRNHTSTYGCGVYNAYIAAVLVQHCIALHVPTNWFWTSRGVLLSHNLRTDSNHPEDLLRMSDMQGAPMLLLLLRTETVSQQPCVLLLLRQVLQQPYAAAASEKVLQHHRF